MIAAEKPNPVTLNLYQLLRRHRRPMVWTFSGIMLATIAVTFLTPRMYTSEAKLFVRLGRESAEMDPTAVSDHVVLVNESREYEINSVFEMLRSREVMAAVISAIGPQVILERGSSDASMSSSGTPSALASLSSSGSIEDKALKHLSNYLVVAPVKKSNIIDITYTAESPDLARDIVANVIKQAREVHIRVNRTDGSHEFFATQASELREKVSGLEEQLRDLKNASGIVSLPDQRALQLQQIAALERTLLETEARQGASAAEVQAQEVALTTIPETITTSRTVGMPNSAAAAMREQLFAAQGRLQEILSVCTKENPRAIAAAEHVAALQTVLDQEPVQPQVAQGPNAAHQEFDLAHRKGEVTTASLQATATALGEQLVTARKELMRLNGHEAEMARLEREIELATANYKKYSEHLEMSRINDELALKDISNLNVLQPPSFSTIPTKPRRLLNLAMGLIGAIFASLAVGLVLEQRRTGLPAIVFASQSMALPVEHWNGSANGRHERNGVDKLWEPATARNGESHSGCEENGGPKV
jgi:polysaccharide biosynthesis protein PslE